MDNPEEASRTSSGSRQMYTGTVMVEVPMDSAVAFMRQLHLHSAAERYQSRTDTDMSNALKRALPTPDKTLELSGITYTKRLCDDRWMRDDQYTVSKDLNPALDLIWGNLASIVHNASI